MHVSTRTTAASNQSNKIHWEHRFGMIRRGAATSRKEKVSTKQAWEIRGCLFVCLSKRLHSGMSKTKAPGNELQATLHEENILHVVGFQTWFCRFRATNSKFCICCNSKTSISTTIRTLDTQEPTTNNNQHLPFFAQGVTRIVVG